MQGFGYYINGNGGYKSTLPFIHKNNYYVLKALNFLAFTSRDGKQSNIGGPFRAALLSGCLPKSDKVTGFSTDRLGEKLKFLTIQLSDENHPERLMTFRESFFYNNVLAPLFNGYILDKDYAWGKYKLKANCEEELKGKNPLDGALICMYESNSSIIGLNYSKIINSIVMTDQSGNFYLKDEVPLEDQLQITEAIQQQLDEFQNNKRFLANYENPLI